MKKIRPTERDSLDPNDCILRIIISLHIAQLNTSPILHRRNTLGKLDPITAAPQIQSTTLRYVHVT